MSTNEEKEERNVYKKMIDPDYPLLVEFKEKAPGTYRHCNNMLTFCESIAKELNLNTDLMRAAALYHDIGKMNNSSVFSENQNGSNVHESLEPKTSYHLITRHVGDGILILLQIPDMTMELLTIVSQHHGNTVLKFFYDKEDNEDVDKYRYKCSAPTTLESSVLMIADSVEATARSLYNNNKMGNSDNKKKVIEKTVNRLINDNQLDELKVGDLKKIKSVLHKELLTMYHKREDYESEEEEEDKVEKVMNNEI